MLDRAGARCDGETMTRRTWLITGCSAGFGRELARQAIDAGERVMATARGPLDLPGASTAILDVTDERQIAAVVDRTVAEFGRLDVVVNNAGHGSVGAVEELTTADLRALMEVMFFGAVAVTKAVLPVLRRQGSGAIVQMSSMGGQVAPPGFGAYCAAKFALEGISEALAAEVGPLGVRTLIVEPGAFRTEFGGHRMHRSAVIDAYAETVGPTRAAVDGMDGHQPGDPAQAVAAIRAALDQDDPPLRLTLGDDALDAIAAQHERLRKDLDRSAGALTNSLV
jgi:NAD(P)-dependent dehydrogenase (short-subunit alcohol dehydrogenase family)